MPRERKYIAIDLKSFYASVECVERKLNPLTVNLVVADISRTEKTICLAVTPSLKSYGVSGRARLFEVVQKVAEVNYHRLNAAPGRRFSRKSVHSEELERDASLELDYIVAPPRMALYLDYSSRIYQIYLKYIAPEDIHVYSVDEVFIDATAYLDSYRQTAHELAMTIIRDVLRTTGITATAGIGTNLYLSKVAMDIEAKHMPADKDGVRIAELDEMSYRRKLWDHRPLKDFWRIGRGTASKLAQHSVFTMGQLARMSLTHEDLLFRLFGVGAELLIDHAWGWEPCTMEAIKAYRPKSNSFSNGQVLSEPYTFEKARVVMREMADAMALRLVSHGLVTRQVVIYIGYDVSNLRAKGAGGAGLTNGVGGAGLTKGAGGVARGKDMEVALDWYGRKVPKKAHATVNLDSWTSSSLVISKAVTEAFDKVVAPSLMIRRLTIVTNNVIREEAIPVDLPGEVQLDLFAQVDERVDERDNKRGNVHDGVFDVVHDGVHGDVSANDALSADDDSYGSSADIGSSGPSAGIGSSGPSAGREDSSSSLSRDGSDLNDSQIAREHRVQKTILDIKRRYGKNAILKGTNFEEGATAIERNQQLGGHKA